MRYGDGRASSTHTVTDGMYKARIRTRTQWTVVAVWVPAVTVIGFGLGLVWRVALLVAGVSIGPALLPVDIYVRHRVPGSDAQEKDVPNESQICRFLASRRNRPSS